MKATHKVIDTIYFEDEKNRIVCELSEEDRKANHTPEDVWQLSRDNEVWIKDTKTGEYIQILDCT